MKDKAFAAVIMAAWFAVNYMFWAAIATGAF